MYYEVRTILILELNIVWIAAIHSRFFQGKDHVVLIDYEAGL
jgi:hypothetical protein